MITRKTLPGLRVALVDAPRPLGLVPTMGFLHAGHISLVRRAHTECASVGVSIFVNPTQFGPQEDLARYPRNLERDLGLLEPAGADVIWIPSVEVMYPAGYQTTIDVRDLSLPLEGRARPGHFRGVATVVAKLFLAFQPDKAYFGQKDAQQVAVIRRMAADLGFPLDVVVSPTMREPDGLALSSRNSYLSPEERTAATVLHRALSTAKAAYERGEHGAEPLRRTMREVLQAEPLAQIEYVSAADTESLAELERIEDDALFSMAVRIGRTRLIDNFILQRGVWQTGSLIGSDPTALAG